MQEKMKKWQILADPPAKSGALTYLTTSRMGFSDSPRST